MTKSKTIHTETAVLNMDYLIALQNLWDASVDMMTHTQNELGEIYRLSRIVGMFASNKSKVDALRDQLAEAEKKKDIYMLKRVGYLAQRYQEEKAFDKMWSTVALEFDQIVKFYIEKQNNEDLVLTIPCSEEILENSKKYYAEGRENEYQLALETAKAEISL